MKESIGNAALFYVVITFVVVLIMFFVSSLAYSKAFKVKNKIVEEIEKERTYDESVQQEIDNWLGSGDDGQGIGYRVNTGGFHCDSYKGVAASNKSTDYQYCVYEMSTCNRNSDSDRCGTYYHVVAYMYFDIPVIGQMIEIPVSGETLTFIEVNS